MTNTSLSHYVILAGDENKAFFISASKWVSPPRIFSRPFPFSTFSLFCAFSLLFLLFFSSRLCSGMPATLQLYSSMHFISDSSLWFYRSHLLFGWPLPISAWCLWKWQLHLSMEACQILKRLCPVDLLSTTKISLRFLIFSPSLRDEFTNICIQSCYFWDGQGFSGLWERPHKAVSSYTQCSFSFF